MALKSKEWFYKQCIIEVDQNTPFEDLSWDILKKGIVKAAARAGKVATEGEVRTIVTEGGTRGTIVEVNTQTDAKNCGGCGKECPGAANATPYCFVGECHFGCSTGWGDCNAKPEDGCEADLMSDEANCGACRIACR